MGAFVIAGLIAFVTFVLALIGLFGAGMSDSPIASYNAISTSKFIFFVGMTLAALTAGSHFLPHLGW